VPAYWPGASYVDWVGIDGYYVRPRNTFQSRFMPTIRAVRKLTHKPLLISEAAVGPAAGQARGIRNLFAAIRRHQLTGLVWFDMHQHGGINHQNWRLEDNPAALAAFRQTEPRFRAAPAQVKRSHHGVPNGGARPGRPAECRTPWPHSRSPAAQHRAGPGRATG
jgi:hypothetical protein